MLCEGAFTAAIAWILLEQPGRVAIAIKSKLLQWPGRIDTATRLNQRRYSTPARRYPACRAAGRLCWPGGSRGRGRGCVMGIEGYNGDGALVFDGLVGGIVHLYGQMTNLTVFKELANERII